ncbi:MAG: hypothetical protein ACLPVO_04665 [Desulfomonilaceae bacterium]
MYRRRLLTIALLLGLSMALVAGPANAWEFSMNGTFTWLYEIRGQNGANGFFGAYDQAQASGVPVANVGYSPYTPAGAPVNLNLPGIAAPYNFYVGGYHNANATSLGVWSISPAAYGGTAIALAGGESIISGSDAQWNIFYMSTDVNVAINKAVKITGNYFVGSWNSPNYSTSSGLMVSSGLMEQDSPGVQRSFSPGYWRTLWVTIQLPIATIKFGKRPAEFGMGLQYDGSDNRSQDSLAVSAQYGPFELYGSIQTCRRAYATDDYGTNAVWYNERADKNNSRVFEIIFPRVRYHAGNFSTGFFCDWRFNHFGGEGVLADPNTNAQAPGSRGVQARDVGEQWGILYAKYNNGRFFINMEYDYDRQTERRSGYMSPSAYAASASSRNQAFPPLDTQHDSGAVEFGAMCGPSKLSFIGAWFTGDDYRYTQTPLATSGIYRVLVTAGKQSDTWSNVSVFRPYSYLMIYGYGLGTSFARDTGEGFVQDATVYATRLDYALAANLNIYGSFTWAEKFSKSGDLWGCLLPNPGPAGAPFSGSALYLKGSNSVRQIAIPTIPDTSLGWEIDCGMDWKLLEGVTTRWTVGYWAPGKWFSYACVDKNQLNWGDPSQGRSANHWHVNPGKPIDSIWGSEFKIETSF